MEGRGSSCPLRSNAPRALSAEGRGVKLEVENKLKIN
eukprot:COSAG06_NODE_1228_length_10179_cov_3.735119_2_plen_37_part_00